INGSPGTVTFGSVAINGTAGDGVDISGANGAININGGVVGGGNDPGGIGVDIDGGAGTINIAAAITQTTGGNLVQATNRTARALSGASSGPGGAANGIDANGNPGGSIPFRGATKALSTGANAAVSLVNNTGATINFPGGGLDIDTTTGAGLTATGGGTTIVA